jgi:heme-degrading monooxygenase HmoA
MTGPTTSYVVASDLSVDLSGAAALEAAFADRLHQVEGHPGFQRLEVWRDSAREGQYVMVSWWDDEAAFRSYLRSDRHRASHDRIPTEPARARGVGLRRYTLVAT